MASGERKSLDLLEKVCIFVSEEKEKRNSQATQHLPFHDRQTLVYHQEKPKREHMCVCSWVTPDTKITRRAKQSVDVDSMLFQGPPQRELCKNGRKVLHASFRKINPITLICKTLQATVTATALLFSMFRF